MKSSVHGESTSEAQVLNVDAMGIWLLVRGKEYFLAHDEFPWFRDAPIGDVLNVTLEHEGHLRWPALDVDLSIESIEHPESFPLTDRGGAPAHLRNRPEAD